MDLDENIPELMPINDANEQKCINNLEQDARGSQDTHTGKVLTFI